jgi:hypothetical protein
VYGWCVGGVEEGDSGPRQSGTHPFVTARTDWGTRRRICPGRSNLEASCLLVRPFSHLVLCIFGDPQSWWIFVREEAMRVVGIRRRRIYARSFGGCDYMGAFGGFSGRIV